MCDLADALRGNILQSMEEEKMATIKDVAEMAGVSICTVSRALAGKDRIRPQTRERVLEAVKALNYEPNYSARSLKTGSTATMGLIVPDIENPYYPKIAKNIEKYSEEKGYMILLCNANEDLNKEKRLVETLKNRGVDGVIVLPCSRHIEHFKSLEKANIPYVFVNREFFGVENCVPSDNFYGAYEMTKYVLEKGHRRIAAAFLSFENSIYQARYEGILEALDEYGIKNCAENFLFNIKDVQDAADRLEKLFRMKERPTALISSNDMICLGAYSAAGRCGLKIPEDISVTGYDDIVMAKYMMPPLTSFRQPEDEMAKVSVDFLLACIRGEKLNRPKPLKGKIVIRESVDVIQNAQKWQ